MNSRCRLLAVAAIALAFPQSAAGASEIGQIFTPSSGTCAADTVYLQAVSPNNAYAVPHPGVISSWSIRGGPQQINFHFVVARSAGDGATFTIVGTSPMYSTLPGGYTFEHNFPVQAGDVIGIYTSDAGVCGAADASGYQTRTRKGDLANGATASFAPGDDLQLALSATVEPDQDGDGLGDETEDSCPTFAASMNECPDVRAPDTKWVKDAPRRTHKEDLRFKFRSDEPESRFQCKLDRERWRNCRSPKRVKVEKGRHVFRVRAIDLAGNVDSSPARDRFRVLG